MLIVVRAFMGEKKARGVQASPLVRSSVTKADHPVGVTGRTANLLECPNHL